jgi:hypothetical protein
VPPVHDRAGHVTILDAALALHDAGCAVLPAAADGTKRPAGNWKQFQTTRPSREQTYALVERAEGIGVLCGPCPATSKCWRWKARRCT